MCGIVGYLGREDAAPTVYAGLSFLQHRGQDSAGIASMEGSRLFIEKGRGLAREVFDPAKIGALRERAESAMSDTAPPAGRRRFRKFSRFMSISRLESRWCITAILSIPKSCGLN